MNALDIVFINSSIGLAEKWFFFIDAFIELVENRKEKSCHTVTLAAHIAFLNAKFNILDLPSGLSRRLDVHK
jgi:hypothetical protein